MPDHTPDLPDFLQYKAAKELKQLERSSDCLVSDSAAKDAAAKDRARKLRLRTKSKKAEALRPKYGSACSYKTSSPVSCRVLAKEGDGYAVLTTIDNLPGKLTTLAKYEIGSEVVGIFVCVHRSRLMFNPLFVDPQ